MILKMRTLSTPKVKAVGLGLLVIMALAGAILVSSKTPRQKRLDRSLTEARRDCERKTCIHLPEHEATNCVNECLSPACFAQVYGEEPLEPGELDHARFRVFNACTKREGRKVQEAFQKERYKNKGNEARR